MVRSRNAGIGTVLKGRPDRVTGTRHGTIGGQLTKKEVEIKAKELDVETISESVPLLGRTPEDHRAVVDRVRRVVCGSQWAKDVEACAEILEALGLDPKSQTSTPKNVGGFQGLKTYADPIAT